MKALAVAALLFAFPAVAADGGTHPDAGVDAGTTSRSRVQKLREHLDVSASAWDLSLLSIYLAPGQDLAVATFKDGKHSVAMFFVFDGGDWRLVQVLGKI